MQLVDSVWVEMAGEGVKATPVKLEIADGLGGDRRGGLVRRRDNETRRRFDDATVRRGWQSCSRHRSSHTNCARAPQVPESQKDEC